MLLLHTTFYVSQHCLAFWALKKFDHFEKVIFVTSLFRLLILAFLRKADPILTN